MCADDVRLSAVEGTNSSLSSGVKALALGPLLEDQEQRNESRIVPGISVPKARTLSEPNRAVDIGSFNKGINV